MPDPRWFECPVLIPYMGGKFELSRKLIPMIPPHFRYIEVFLGGGSMFFRKKKAKLNVLNDKHNDLINLYLTVMEYYEIFMKHCESLLKSRLLYNSFKKDLKKEINYYDMPDPKRAAKYFYIIKNAFNVNFHNPIAKESEWNEKMWNCLSASKQKLQDTMIENIDFRDLLKKYPVRDDDFWYFDPPYVIAGERGDYYVHSLTEKDHLDLSVMADTINDENGKFMISYDDHRLVHELYDKYIITEIPVKYSGQLHGKDYKNELVITNFKPVNYQLTIL